MKSIGKALQTTNKYCAMKDRLSIHIIQCDHVYFLSVRYESQQLHLVPCLPSRSGRLQETKDVVETYTNTSNDVI